MAVRYFCLDEKYMIPDPEWSYQNNGSDQCYVKAADFERVSRAWDEANALLRYYETSRTTSNT